MLNNLRDMLPLNFNLLSNPVNWVIVVLMIVIAGLMMQVIISPNGETETNG